MQGNTNSGMGGEAQVPSSPVSTAKRSGAPVEYDSDLVRPAKRCKVDASSSAIAEETRNQEDVPMASATTAPASMGKDAATNPSEKSTDEADIDAKYRPSADGIASGGAPIGKGAMAAPEKTTEMAGAKAPSIRSTDDEDGGVSIAIAKIEASVATHEDEANDKESVASVPIGHVGDTTSASNSVRDAAVSQAGTTVDTVASQTTDTVSSTPIKPEPQESEVGGGLDSKPLISQETRDWLQHGTQSSDVKPYKIEQGAIDAAMNPPVIKREEDDHGRVKGVAPIKEEYLLRGSDDPANGDSRSGPKKARGQNFNRRNGVSGKLKSLCSSIGMSSEFSAPPCKFGEKCKYTHNLREYLDSQFGKPEPVVKTEDDSENAREPEDKEATCDTAEVVGEQNGQREDGALEGDSIRDKCHNYETFGWCPAGWRCHFVKAHMQTFTHADGKEELVLTQRTKDEDDESKTVDRPVLGDPPSLPSTIGNVVSREQKYRLQRNKIDFSKAQEYINWLNNEGKLNDTFHNRRKEQSLEGIDDLRASFVEPPFKPSEKRRLYFGPDTPVLAPLTTQGNMPFRRLCVDLGCEITYSEMAYGGELLRGNMADWALMKAHETELSPPRDGPGRPAGYDRGRDMRFGAQVSANHHKIGTKVASILSQWCPQLRVIDINCGCPLDAVYKTGAGSGLLASTNKLERIIRGMNTVSGDIPITAKIRMGVQTGRPTATKLIGQLAFGSREHRTRLGAPGCAAVTLHGRSREQRYTKKADWNYIAECGELVTTYNQELDDVTDTVREPDASTQANSSRQRMWFIGNGDCYSHEEYYDHIEKAKVDSVMIGRGALIKPWIFEEIQAKQYLDKTSAQRMEYMQQFVNYGLETWGCDAYGLNTTRRFLMEWMSFSHRYIPVGILDVLPPDMNDRPPAYMGRDPFETKLASKNASDWAELADHFLGPAPDEFSFTPKYKSNSYDAEG